MLVFNNPGNTTFAGAISGNGSLTQAGTGILTLTNSNTYTGNTTVSAGTLQVGNGGSGEFLGSPSVSLSNNTSLVFSQSDSLTYGGIISGSGSLTQAGSGDLTLLGANSYSGSTTVSGGTLQVGNGGSGEFLGSPSVVLSNSAALVFNESDAPVYSGSISGNGSLTQTGSGTVTLTGSNTYTGGTTVSAGTLQVGNGGSGAFLGSPTVGLSSSTALVFSQSDSMTYSGMISGSGSLVQAGPGLLTLTGSSNTYTGGTTISDGTLQVGNGILAGNVGPGAVINNGILVFDFPGAATTFSGVVSGNGSLTQAGTGVLTLLGSNTFTGGTTISSGTIQIGNGGTTGVLTGGIAIGIAEALVLDRSGSMNFMLSGAGTLSKTGSGTTTLTGDSTGFAGPVSVVQGQLVVAGPMGLGGFSIVGSDATLQFSGATINLNNAIGSVWALTGGTVQYQNAIINGGYLYGPGTHVLAASTNNTFNGTTIRPGTPIQQNGPATFNNVTNYGQITGNGGLTWFGGDNGGTIFLSGTNNVWAWGDSGPLTIQSGGLLNNHLGNLTVSSGQVTINPFGTLNADSDGQGLSLNLQGSSLLINNGTVVGTTNVNYGATITGSGAFGPVNLSYGGTLDLISQNANVSALTGVGTVNHSGVGHNTLTVGSGNFTGTIENGAGVVALLKTGSGQLTLGGSNSYTGGTTISAGTLSVAADDNLGTGGLDFNGSGAGVLEITGTNAFGSAKAVDLSLSGTIQQDDTANATLSGTISGTGALLKTGAGDLILSGSNSYTGGTIVESGTLYVTKSSALAEGTSLTVGAEAMSLFDQSAEATMANSQTFTASHGAAAAVPEPGTLALLSVAGLVAAAAAWRRKKPVRRQ